MQKVADISPKPPGERRLSTAGFARFAGDRALKTENSTQKTVSIIGGGLGGLSASIYLRLAGYDVTIYEANERLGGRANLIERDGFRFDTGPSLLNYPWVFEQLFQAAGRNFYDYVELLPVEPSVSFQWQDGTRLSLSSNMHTLMREFERVEPGCGARLVAYLRDAAEKYRLAFDKLVTRNEASFARWLGGLSPGEMMKTAVWRSLDGELRRFFKSRHLREALGSYGMYLGGSPFDLPGLFSLLPYGEISHGLWLPRGGIYALVGGIERLARELGVNILTNRRVRKIVTRGGRVLGVELDGGRVVKSDIVVTNVDVPTTNSELLGRESLSAKTRRRTEKTRMTPGVLTFYWGVRGKVENLGHHTIFLPRDFRGTFDDLLKRRRIPDDMAFYVAVPSATDAELAPAGDTTIFVLVPTPLLSEMPEVNWETVKEETKSKILKRLKEHGIELPQERIAVEEVLTPADWRARFGLYDGSAFGAAHTLFQVGPLRAPNHSEEIKGLYYVGAGTTPGTGMPMVVLGGRMTAERVICR